MTFTTLCKKEFCLCIHDVIRPDPVLLRVDLWRELLGCFTIWLFE